MFSKILAGQELEERKKFLIRKIKHDPLKLSTYYKLAQLYEGQRQLYTAINLYSQVIEFEPKQGKAFFKRAMAWLDIYFQSPKLLQNWILRTVKQDLGKASEIMLNNSEWLE